MPTPGNGTTDLYLTSAGIGTKTATIPYDITQLDARQATQVIELALGLAMSWFWSEYGRLRFEPYARVKLGYRITPAHQKRKNNRANLSNPDAKNPNVWTGETKRMALGMSHVETRGIGGKGNRTSMQAMAQMRIKMPGYINQQRGQITNAVMSKMTTDEFDRVADKFFRYVAEMLASVTTRLDPAATGRGRTNPIRPMVAEQYRANFGMTSRATIIASRRSAAGETRASS